MLKIKNLNEIQNIPFPALKRYISKKVQSWADEYALESLDEIGCFIILNAEEKALFKESEMEFTEVLTLNDEIYLHGVKITGDCYGEDTFFPVERVRK